MPQVIQAISRYDGHLVALADGRLVVVNSRGSVFMQDGQAWRAVALAGLEG